MQIMIIEKKSVHRSNKSIALFLYGEKRKM